jgi:hypothetical protein
MDTVSFYGCADVTGHRMSKGRWGVRIPTKSSVPTVRCSFNTRQFGILQVSAARKEDQSIIIEPLSDEPNLHLFTDEERKYIKAVSAIVYRLVFEYRNP